MNAGLHEDGYEAIDFAVKNVPFRDSPFIAKNIILITDEGRTPIPRGDGETRLTPHNNLERERERFS